MSFLFGSSKKKIPEITGLQIQTAVNILPIPIIYGSPRVTMNIIYVNGFRAEAQKAGGKGLLTGGKGETTGYKYYATFVGALGEGPLGEVRVVFDNQATYSPSNPPLKRGFMTFPGDGTQTAWVDLAFFYPDDAFAYRHTSYLGFPDYSLDSSATIPQLGFVVDGLFVGTCPLNLYTAPDATSWFMDADPAECIYDFLTNDRYGVQFPVAYIDLDTVFTSASGFTPLIGDAALSTYCQATGLGWSTVLNNAEPASSILDRWCKNLVVAPVWTGSILKFLPYWDTYADTNPGWDASAGIDLKYFQPFVTPVFDLDDDDFIQTDQGEDPIVVSRIDVAEAKNLLRLDYRDRGMLFNNNVSEAKDEINIDLYGPRVSALGTADEFTHGNYAGTSVQMQLQRSISIRNTYMFRLGWQYCVLDPMDIVTLTDTVLGLDMFPVRIRTIEEDEKGILTIVAEEFPFGAATATAYPRQNNEPPFVFETNITVRSVNDPVIFEPTVGLLAARGQAVPTVIIGASGGPSGVFDPNWGGCEVYLSDDNVTYVRYGTLSGASRQGVLTSLLPEYLGANPDTINTLQVDLSESNGALTSATAAQAEAGLTVCAIVDANGDLELLSFTDATLTAPNEYDLTDLYRGMYGTIPCEHLVGSEFLRIDSLVFETPLPPEFIGTLIYAKLQSFNIFGQALQDLADCTVYTYFPTGQGTNFSSNALLQALLMGSNVDLNSSSVDLDLNLGGSGACAPVSTTVDLGVG